MALPLKSGADFYTQEIRRVALQNEGSDLPEYLSGSIYFNTNSESNTSDRIRYRGRNAWHSVANLEDIARLEGLIAELGDVSGGNITDLLNKIEALEGNFTDGAANDSLKLAGQLPSYYATASGLSALQEKVSAFLDGEADSDAVLENLKEIQAFLDSYDGATSLADMFAAVNAQIADRYTKGEVDTKLSAYRLLTNGVFDVLVNAKNGIETDEITIGGIKLSVVDGQLQIDGDAFATGQLASGGIGEAGSGSGASGIVILEDWSKYDDSVAQVVGAVLGKDLHDRLGVAESTIESLVGKATNVSVVQTLTSGKEIGAITIDGVATKLYAPATYAWGEITSKPTTLAGYGITDAIRHQNGIVLADAPYNVAGYGYSAHAWKASGPAMSIGIAEGYLMQIQSSNSDGSLYHRHVNAGTPLSWYKILDENNYASVLGTVYAPYNAAGYLPLSGGTITGGFGSFAIMRDGEKPSSIRFVNTSTALGAIGFNTSSSPCIWDGSGTNERRLLHEGNYSSILDNVYFKKSGGTITTVYNEPLVIHNPNTESGSYIVFKSGDVKKAYFGYSGGGFAFIQYGDSSVLGVKSDGVYYNNQIMLHSSNFNSYAPTLTGTGASGRWDISISGSATAVEGRGRIASANLTGNADQLKWFLASTSMTEGKPMNDSQVLHMPWDGDNYNAQLAIGHDGPSELFVQARRQWQGTWSDWKTLAFTDSNVASATKLATARSLWGNSFDGTANVNGTINLPFGRELSIAEGQIRVTNNSIIYKPDTNYGWSVGTYFYEGSTQVAGFLAKGSSTANGGFYQIGMYAGSHGVILNSSGNVSVATYDYASTNYRFAVGDGKTMISAYNNSSPTLGNMATNALLVGSSNYGVQHWITGDGHGHIQVGRFDGTATAYALNLQPLGGDVNVGANLKVGGKMAVGSSVLDAYHLYVGGDTRVDGALWTYGHIRPVANGAYYLGLVDNAWAGAAFTGNVLLGSSTEGIYINGSSLNWHTDRNAWSATLASFSKTMLTSHVLAFLGAGALIPTGQTLKIGDATLSWDSTSNALKVDKDFYSDGQVSSGGVAEEGTGGAVGGSGLERVVFTIPANTTTFDCVHNLGTREISVAIYEEGNDYQQILTDVYLDSTNIARVVFGSATDVAHKVVIIG